ncbi:alpha/beta fold hydrolase [Ensifer soli]|uniref:alpha/beta fold hydrolase n=1 Tax=Ciceribacter sp. sgz301302 TaxID=3342379 RepID=UPI0035B9F11B
MAAPEDGRPGLTDGQKAEIIDCVYEVAVDPERFESLMNLWEEKIAPIRRAVGEAGPGPLFNDPFFEGHFHRASTVLDRQPQAGGNAMSEILAGFLPSAAFAVSGAGMIADVNWAARWIFGIKPGDSLSALPFADDQIADIAACIRRVARHEEVTDAFFRGQSLATQRLVVFRISPLPAGRGEDGGHALVVSTELVWPQALTGMIRDAFSLTQAEVEVVRGLAEGATLQAIARERRRSVATVRTQLRSILAKTETHTQAELVRITLNLMDVVGPARESARDVATVVGSGGLEPLPFRSLYRPAGRRIDYVIIGDPAGQPMLFLPMNFGLIRWPASAERYARAEGLCVIVPIRPGFGHSTPVKDRKTLTDIVSDDMAALLDALGIRAPCPIIALSCDGYFAFHFHKRHPGRLSAIFVCGAGLPFFTRQQYERMHKWHRFIIANARYAPVILPFLVKAGFSLARRIGKRAFVHAVYGDAAGDVDVFEQPDVMQALITGSEVCISDWHSAHDAFSHEVILQQADWRAVVSGCDIPVTCYQGHQDPAMPPATIEEMKAAFPHINFIEDPRAGELIFFKHWREIVDRARSFPSG